jgi:GNAT superfamily N-acetyltransferase
MPNIIALENDNTQAASYIRQQLYAYNWAQTGGEDGYLPLNIIVRDEAQAILGGLLGATYWGWLVIDILWIAEALRGQGYGTQMLQMAEAEALLRGCHGAHLDTMSFQALPFYLKHGYSVFGEIEDLPRGHTRHFLKKKLQPTT